MKRAVQIRDMHTGIHNIYILKEKVIAVEIISAFETLKNSSETEQEFLWDFINNKTQYFTEINFRNYEMTPKGNKYFLVNDEKIFVVNQHSIDVW